MEALQNKLKLPFESDKSVQQIVEVANENVLRLLLRISTRLQIGCQTEVAKDGTVLVILFNLEPITSENDRMTQKLRIKTVLSLAEISAKYSLKT